MSFRKRLKLRNWRRIGQYLRGKKEYLLARERFLADWQSIEWV